MSTRKPSSTAPSASASNRPNRCRHVSRNGRPCRYLAAAPTDYCKNHVPKDKTKDTLELLHKVMAKNAENLETPEGVSNVLYTIFFATLDGDISERRAGVLTYLAQTILNTQRAVTEHDKRKRQQATETAQRNLSTCIYLPHRPAPAAPPKPAAIAQPATPAPPTPQVTSEPKAATPPAAEPAKPPAPVEPPTVAPQSSPAPVAQSSSAESPKSPDPSPEPAKPPRKKSAPLPKPDLNHFFPQDPTLSPNLQNPRTLAPNPPPIAALNLRNTRFNRANGIRSGPAKRAHPLAQDPDWKLLHGR
jgi:outer membrane biosynthesis protein TonB